MTVAKFPENGTPAERAAHMREWGCGGCQRGASIIDALSAEIDALAARLASVERERDEIMAMAERREGKLQARLAKIESGLRRCADYLENSATCNSDRAMASMARAALAPDSADVMHDNNTNVIVQANLASTLTSHPSLSPTHCCVDCGALWRQCDDFSMNLRSASCCDACNNAPVGPQIRPIYVAPSSADVERRPCTCHPDDNPPVPCPRMYALHDCRRAAALAAEIESLRSRLAEARCVCDEQATDAGLWFVAETVTEAYLQAALRRLHAAVEGTADSAPGVPCGTLPDGGYECSCGSCGA